MARIGLSYPRYFALYESRAKSAARRPGVMTLANRPLSYLRPR